MDISVDIGIDSLHEYIDLQEDDVVLYLGGRIDDDNLYPTEYRKYLNYKIKELKPSKIIGHSHWYAKKYYSGEVLDESTKIDMVLVHRDYFSGALETINPTDYGPDHRSYIKTLIDKNVNMVYAIYNCGASFSDSPKEIEVDSRFFGQQYDLANIKYFYFDRPYCPDDLVAGTGRRIVSATDGFAVITHLVKAGFKNLNIVGFTAFGSNEDQSYFSEYSLTDSRFAGKKYFDIKTSENQRIEADILRYYVKQKRINNLENYGELRRCLKVDSLKKDMLNRIEATEVQNEPFDHLIVDNLLPTDFYERLAKELDSEDFHKNYKRGPYGNKERFGVDMTDYSSWKSSGRKIETQMYQDNYNSLVSNGSGNIKLFFDLLLENKEELYRTLYAKLPTEKMQTDYFFHMSMVKDSVGYTVEAHTDDEQNIFTILFYAPKTDINKEFGLHVYKDAQPLSDAKSIDFIPNRMIAFSPCKPDKGRIPTWHEVRRLSDKLVGTRNSFQLFFYKS